MKKRESVIICPLLCISLLLTALASPLAVSVGVSAASNTAAEAGTEAEAAVPELILSKCYLIESDNYESIADGYFQAVLLSEESAGKFPALSSALSELNTQISASCRKDFKELSDKSRQYITEHGVTDEDRPSATFESRIVPVRQDDKAVSFFTSCYSFLPGAAGGTTTCP